MNDIEFKFGWKKDVEDVRDYIYELNQSFSIQTIPTKVDLRPHCPIIVDQGPLNASVGNAIAGALQIRQIKQGKVYYDPAIGRTMPYTSYVFAPSRLFIYYGARELEGTQNEDAGAQIRNGIKFVAKTGAATSKSWPYHSYTVNTKPAPEAYQTAEQRGGLLKYHRILSINRFAKLNALADGNAIIFGFSVFSNFLTTKVTNTGYVGMPKSKDKLIGGQAAVIVGYDLSTQRYLCRNSWGVNWGDKGYFTIPFEYLDNPFLAGDFWITTQVE